MDVMHDISSQDVVTIPVYDIIPAGSIKAARVKLWLRCRAEMDSLRVLEQDLASELLAAMPAASGGRPH